MWDGKVYRLSSGQGEQKKPKEKTSPGREEWKLHGKEEEVERKSFGGWTNEKMQEGAKAIALLTIPCKAGFLKKGEHNHASSHL